MAPKKRKRNTLEADPDCSWFCRPQKSEADIPILPVNVTGGEKHLNQALLILQKREEKISPFKIMVEGYSIHVTPLPNPLSSHHILQLYSPRLQEFKADMLIEDASLYFTAFRCHVRMRTAATGDFPLGPRRWNVFADQVNSLPRFLKENADKIDMESSYRGGVRVGGIKTVLHKIFEQLVYFDKYREVTDEFQAAMHSLMAIYCETRRSRGMQGVVFKRMKELHAPGLLPDMQDRTKNMWKTFSYEALEMKRDGTITGDARLRPCCYHGVLNFKILSQLIGERGELLIAKQDREMLCRHVTEEWFNEEANKVKTPGAFANPMFTVPVDSSVAGSYVIGHMRRERHWDFLILSE